MRSMRSIGEIILPSRYWEPGADEEHEEPENEELWMEDEPLPFE